MGFARLGQADSKRHVPLDPNHGLFDGDGGGGVRGREREEGVGGGGGGRTGRWRSSGGVQQQRNVASGGGLDGGRSDMGDQHSPSLTGAILRHYKNK